MIKSREENFIRICKICGEEFQTVKKKGYVCEDCNNRKRINKLKTVKKSNKQSSRKPRQKYLDISLNDMVRNVEKYNKKHGTLYTYGQFVSLLQRGKIKLKK